MQILLTSKNAFYLVRQFITARNLKSLTGISINLIKHKNILKAKKFNILINPHYKKKLILSLKKNLQHLHLNYKPN